MMDLPCDLDSSFPPPSTVTISGLEETQVRFAPGTGRFFPSTTRPAKRWVRFKPCIVACGRDRAVAAGFLAQAVPPAASNNKTPTFRSILAYALLVSLELEDSRTLAFPIQRRIRRARRATLSRWRTGS